MTPCIYLCLTWTTIRATEPPFQSHLFAALFLQRRKSHGKLRLACNFRKAGRIRTISPKVGDLVVFLLIFLGNYLHSCGGGSKWMSGNENYVHLCTIPDTSSSEVEVEYQTYAWGTDTLDFRWNWRRNVPCLSWMSSYAHIRCLRWERGWVGRMRDKSKNMTQYSPSITQCQISGASRNENRLQWVDKRLYQSGLRQRKVRPI